MKRMSDQESKEIEIKPRGINRREFLKASAACGVGAALYGSAISGVADALQRPLRLPQGRNRKRVLVLGMDGMDPGLYRQLARKGLLPNFQRLESLGGFTPLGTSIPPQSPVAWANFATGMDPGGHGIFDFIKWDRENMNACFSTAQMREAEHKLELFGWRIPLGSGRAELLRKGIGFWNLLEDHGIRCRIIRLPANFPPEETQSETLSGIGTPDLLGTIGTFTCITDDPQFENRRITGAVVRNVRMSQHRTSTYLKGPRNAFKKGKPHLSCQVEIYRDAVNEVVKIVLQESPVLLKRGELSDWVSIKFKMIPGFVTVRGICRFYLRAVHPHLVLYVSPIQIDPRDPALPISTPHGFSQKLAESVGLFSTIGIGEDMRAYRDGVLDSEGYFKQAVSVMGEWKRLFREELSKFDEGLLFFYFSSIDTNSHMFWWAMDPAHPAHEENNGYEEAVTFFYREMDRCLGEAMQQMKDKETVIVFSDHGFAPYYYSFDLNRWLVENGYLKYRSRSRGDSVYHISWSRTKAFALGLNGLYLNLAGRDLAGKVRPDDRDKLVRELINGLLSEKDPVRGKNVITQVYDTRDCYHSKGGLKNAPDLIIGYNREYRACWENTGGGISGSGTTITANKTKWTGDHCMDAKLLSGCFFSNKRLIPLLPNLQDVTATLLNLYGVAQPKQVTGKNILFG